MISLYPFISIRSAELSFPRNFPSRNLFNDPIKKSSQIRDLYAIDFYLP